MNILWLFLPDEILVLVVACLAVGLMTGLLRGSVVLSLLAVIVLSMLIGPLIESVVATLPLWLTWLVLVVLAFWIFRQIVDRLLGRSAVNIVVGTLAARAVLCFFRLILLPFRVIGWMFLRRLRRL